MNQFPWKHIQDKIRNQDVSDENELQSWLDKDPENDTILNDLKVFYAITGNVPESFEPEKTLAWQRILNRISVKKRVGNVSLVMRRIAASLLLVALGAGSVYFYHNQTNGTAAASTTEVYSPYGHKTFVQLPDSSQVWLNGNSKIVYNTNFNEVRNVTLTGEALFKVTKNPNKVFTVNSGELNLKVYGTTFNVKSYPEDMVTEVALVEGSVGLFHEQKMFKKMVPGEVIAYLPGEDSFRSQKGDITQIISWHGDELVIENETFENIVKYLERWYGVTIVLDNSLKQNSRLSFKVKTESLTELLSIINHITPIAYEISGKHVKLYKK